MRQTKKSPKVIKARWSLGVFQSAADGSPIVCYCKKDGTVAPYLRKTVKNQKARVHVIYFGMTYAQARAKLLKQAKVTPAKKSGAKKPPVTKEVSLKTAA